MLLAALRDNADETASVAVDRKPCDKIFKAHGVAAKAVAVIIWAFSATAAAGQNFSPKQQDWLNTACPKSLGPSQWRSCMEREGAALQAPYNQSVERLTDRQRRWVAESCPRSLGPSLYRSCVDREVSALIAPGGPDPTTLPSDQRAWLLQSCPQSLGPSLWRSCAEREMSALRPQAPPPIRKFSAPAPARPPAQPKPVIDQREERRAANRKHVSWPAWSGPMPAITLASGVHNQLDAREVFRTVAPSVYLVIATTSIEDLKEGKGSLGSAVAIASDMAITNCHVIEGQSIVTLNGDETDQPILARLYKAHPSSDRCVLKTESVLRPIKSIRESGNLAIGERVYTIGNPSGLSKTLGEGLVSGLRKSGLVELVQTTAQISKGSSGGALVDSSGALIGVTTFLLRDAQNLNFAIAAHEYWK